MRTSGFPVARPGASSAKPGSGPGEGADQNHRGQPAEGAEAGVPLRPEKPVRSPEAGPRRTGLPRPAPRSPVPQPFRRGALDPFHEPAAPRQPLRPLDVQRAGRPVNQFRALPPRPTGRQGTPRTGRGTSPAPSSATRRLPTTYSGPTLRALRFQPDLGADERGTLGVTVLFEEIRRDQAQGILVGFRRKSRPEETPAQSGCFIRARCGT